MGVCSNARSIVGTPNNPAYGGDMGELGSEKCALLVLVQLGSEIWLIRHLYAWCKLAVDE